MKYGYFDVKRREYVIDRVDVPVSWTNYLGVEELCAVVNHTAGGYPPGGERGAVGSGPGKHLGPSPFAECVLLRRVLLPPDPH